MILFVNPRVTRPKNRRFPLSLMMVGAALPDGTSWEIVDGNRPDVDTFANLIAHVERQAGGNDAVRVIAMSVMPGPQLVSAVPLTKMIKARFPSLPIAWGGYFPSLYPKPVLNSGYVDWIIRGQGSAHLQSCSTCWTAGAIQKQLRVWVFATATRIGSAPSESGSALMTCRLRPITRSRSTNT
jgi:hypothetical protein